MLYSLAGGGGKEGGGAGATDGEKKGMNAVCRYIFSFQQLYPLPFRGGKKLLKSRLEK